MKLTNRGVHRDLGYFFIGLIISFAISGIMLNHRRAWNPTKYTSEIRKIEYELDQSAITDEGIASAPGDYTSPSPWQAKYKIERVDALDEKEQTPLGTAMVDYFLIID